MAAEFYSRVSGVWREITECYARVSGVWREVAEGSTRVSGVWRTFFVNKVQFLLTIGTTGGKSPSYGYAEGVYGDLDPKLYRGESVIQMGGWSGASPFGFSITIEDGTVPDDFIEEVTITGYGTETVDSVTDPGGGAKRWNFSFSDPLPTSGTLDVFVR